MQFYTSSLRNKIYKWQHDTLLYVVVWKQLAYNYIATSQIQVPVSSLFVFQIIGIVHV